MSNDKQNKDDVERIFTGLGNMTVILADMLEPEQMTMFIHSPGRKVHFCTMFNEHGLVAVMMDADEHRVGLDAIHNSEVVEDHTEQWNSEPAGDATMSGENMSSFVATILRPVVELQGLTEVALYCGRSEPGAMAFKYENGTFWAGVDREDNYSDAFLLPARTGMEGVEEELPNVIPLLDLSRAAMGEDFPEHLFHDEPEPHERPAFTPQQLVQLLDPEATADDWEPIEGAYIDIPGVEARRVQMTKGLARLVEGQKQAFREKFGRDPGPGDPIFFDPDADTPQELSPEKSAEMHDLWERLNLERTREIRDAQLEEQGMMQRRAPKVGRNDPCPCGSGQKFKHCHGR